MKFWSWWTDSNPRPANYKSAALPTELHQRMSVTNNARETISQFLRFVKCFFIIFGFFCTVINRSFVPVGPGIRGYAGKTFHAIRLIRFGRCGRRAVGPGEKGAAGRSRRLNGKTAGRQDRKVPRRQDGRTARYHGCRTARRQGSKLSGRQDVREARRHGCRALTAAGRDRLPFLRTRSARDRIPMPTAAPDLSYSLPVSRTSSPSAVCRRRPIFSP